MPAKNRIKQYTKDGYYHIYNRGVEKRVIFQDQQDYSVFLAYLREYLTPKDEKTLYKQLTNIYASPSEKEKALQLLRLNNFADEITLFAYCLMPNHFHFLIKQKNSGSMDKFMNSIGTRYTLYFNKKYKRVGSLYQGVYKAVLVTGNEQFLHLSRYIHKQAISLPSLMGEGQPSSYKDYLGIRKTGWVKPEEVLGYFSHINPHLSYQQAVTSGYKLFVSQEDNPSQLQDLILEDEV